MSEDSRQIVRLLAEGIDPITGEVLPDASPYNHPQVIRALFPCWKTTKLQKKPDRNQNAICHPSMASWTQEDRDYVTASYKQGISQKEIAAYLERTIGSIHSELIRLGLIMTDAQPDNILQYETSSFYLYSGPGRISIARIPARHAPAGFKVCRALAPGAWLFDPKYRDYDVDFKCKIA